MAKKSDERLAELRERAAKIAQQKAKVFAEQKSEDKKRKNRQKILYGVVVMAYPELREMADRLTNFQRG